MIRHRTGLGVRWGWLALWALAVAWTAYSLAYTAAWQDANRAYSNGQVRLWADHVLIGLGEDPRAVEAVNRALHDCQTQTRTGL